MKLRRDICPVRYCALRSSPNCVRLVKASGASAALKAMAASAFEPMATQRDRAFNAAQSVSSVST